MKGYNAKYTPPVLFRCESCGAAIRKDDLYHRLHIKGRVICFCKLCVDLSEYRATEPIFTNMVLDPYEEGGL